MSPRRIISGGACVLVALGLVLGFSETGTPERNRLLAIDEKRLEEMSEISQRLYESGDVPVRKPVVAYGMAASATNDVSYERTGKRTYRLCATFALASSSDPDDAGERKFPHPAGLACYDLTAASPDPVTRLTAASRGRAAAP